MKEKDFQNYFCFFTSESTGWILLVGLLVGRLPELDPWMATFIVVQKRSVPI